MTKDAEISYVIKMAAVLNVPYAEVEQYLTRKPFIDPSRGTYLLDMGQIMQLLPPPPARVLDLGVGSGWTTEMLARSGYSVLGLDIAPDMIDIARRRAEGALDLKFEVCDYETSIDFGEFDAVVIYDALHHAEDERRVVANAFGCLKPGGMFITIEPGTGHATTPATRDVVAKFGTTEKDMPYAYQAELLAAAGFGCVRQYLRLSQLVLETQTTADGRTKQEANIQWLTDGTRERGLTSVVVGIKQPPDEDVGEAAPSVAEPAATTDGAG